MQAPTGVIREGSRTLILLNIAAENSNILDDPVPMATFDLFGDSTLNFTLRCCLPDLENRLATIHYVHSEIHRRFAQAGIEIAFPQRDLHIRSGFPSFGTPNQPPEQS